MKMAHILGKYYYETVNTLSKSQEDIVNRICPPKKNERPLYPTLEISKNESEEWTMTTNSFINLTTYKFRLGEEFKDERSKYVATLEDNRLVIQSVGSNDLWAQRRVYEFSDNGCLITYYDQDGSKIFGDGSFFKRQKIEPYLGKFLHESNENLDEYLEAVGVSYIQRKIMCASQPILEISKNESDEWTITISSLFNTQIVKFRLSIQKDFVCSSSEEYEEYMSGGVFKSVTHLWEMFHLLETESVGPNGVKIYSGYQFCQSGSLILTMTHKAPGKTTIEAKRYFKRLE